MARRDVAVAGAMLLLALAVLWESWKMPVFGGQPLSAPGLFPAITAGAIAALALAVLLARAPQALGWRAAPPEAPPGEPLGSVPKVLLCALVTLAALLVMKPLGFVAAGAVATVGLMLAGLGRRPRGWEAALVAAFGVLLPLGTHWLFTQVFLTPLP